MADDPYLSTIDRLEPDIAAIDTPAALASIAISLKRIADNVVPARDRRPPFGVTQELYDALAALVAEFDKRATVFPASTEDAIETARAALARARGEP